MNLKHGHNRRVNGKNKPSLTYSIWKGMIQRCYYKGSCSYKSYGGRGIKVCKRWRDFGNFLKDMGEKPPGKSIDRIKDGDYKPSNCKWSTSKEQARNRSTSQFVFYKRRKWLLLELVESHSKLDVKTVRARLRRGWDIEAALTRVSNKGARY